MAYTTSEARQELLDTVAQAANELGFAGACLAEAYERLDEYNGDTLEAECFRPVQMAYGRAKRTHTEFARRHGFPPAAFDAQPTGPASQGAASFITRAVEAVGVADRILGELQDSMLPVEAGDEELRAGLESIREPLGGLPGKAREFLRGLGR
jgi:class 3 adenylate cyclase